MVEPYIDRIKFLPPRPEFHNKDILHHYSNILGEEEKAKKIISYFPKRQRNFTFLKIYDGDTHGWRIKDFKERVSNQGATLIILKTYEDKICGGFTTKSWGNDNKDEKDKDAFVFNMKNKYTSKEDYSAIRSFVDGGFRFGSTVL
jgi:TLD